MWRGARGGVCVAVRRDCDSSAKDTLRAHQIRDMEHWSRHTEGVLVRRCVCVCL